MNLVPRVLVSFGHVVALKASGSEDENRIHYGKTLTEPACSVLIGLALLHVFALIYLISLLGPQRDQLSEALLFIWQPFSSPIYT